MSEKREKVNFEDICASISSPITYGRFHEIVSVEKIKDTKTGKVYIGIVDSEFVRLINKMDEYIEALENNEEKTFNLIDSKIEEIRKDLEDPSLSLSEKNRLLFADSILTILKKELAEEN